MSIPKICFSKVFWLALTASFSFTILMFNISQNHENAIDAELAKRAEIVYSMPQIQTDIKSISDKIDKQTQDIADIKAQLKLKLK